MYEIILAEWGLDPQYVLDHWTDEQLDLMLDALATRKRREAESLQSASGRGGSSGGDQGLKFQPLAQFAKKYLNR